VWNPGRLPPELSIEKLYRQHASYPRNLRLAAALYRARLIEQWGTGTVRIIRACEKHGITPEFVVEAGTFIVQFRSAAVGAVSTRDASALNERQTKALDYIRTHGSIRRQEYETMYGVSARHALRELTQMVRLGLIDQLGQTRTVRYILSRQRSDA
jgi:ATP-dependent DNA helicase RecG